MLFSFRFFPIRMQVEKDISNSCPSSSETPVEILSKDFLDCDDDAGYEEMNSVNQSDEEYDPDDYFQGSVKKKPSNKMKIEPLPPFDHSSVQYLSFKKNFYVSPVPSPSTQEIAELRSSLNISVVGNSSIGPIRNFDEFHFPRQIVAEIRHQGFEAPTPIQSQAVPLVMSGYDVIALAQTGSGKTLSFVWPLIVHILDQPPRRTTHLEGPIGLILAPTRELVSQIYHEAKKYTKTVNITVCAIYGGAGKYEMTKALQEQPELVVATPGRLIDLLKDQATNLRRCTMVVLDEADRMLDMGFESQMRSIVQQIRPDRQTLLFSATMKKKIESLARELLIHPIRVSVGWIGQANPDIRQIVEIFPNISSKHAWLMSHLDAFVADGKVLLFVSRIEDTEELRRSLTRYFQSRQLAIAIECLHGDMDSYDRSNVLRRFGKRIHADAINGNNDNEIHVLIATDVASRGLDIKDIRTVINYQVPKNIETHIHRIGRTGRMGVEGVTPGIAYSLLLSTETSFAVDLVQNLRLSKQPVAPELQIMAERDPKWSHIRHFEDETHLDSTCKTSRKFSTSVGLGHASHVAPPQSSAEAASRTMGGNISNKTDSTSIIGKNERSKFDNGSNHSTSDFLPSSRLPGFVRSSQVYHSNINDQEKDIVSSDISASIAPTERKRKSKWDT